jgi:integrase
MVRSIDEEQVRTIVDNAPTLREKTLFILMYTTGLRIGEALSLRVEDISGEIIEVRSTKGNRPRRTYVSRALKPMLRRYLRELGYNKGWLFPSPQQPDRPLSYGRARQLFMQAAEGLYHADGARLTPHGFRHAFGTERAGYMDAILLMELMGHRDIRTTLHYAKVTGKAAKQAFEAFDKGFGYP